MPVSVRPVLILFVLPSTGTGSGAGGIIPRCTILVLGRFPSISACVRTVKPEGDLGQGVGQILLQTDAVTSGVPYRETVFRRLKTYQIVVDVSVAVALFAVALPVFAFEHGLA
jgi:hypothetical protein